MTLFESVPTVNHPANEGTAPWPGDAGHGEVCFRRWEVNAEVTVEISELIYLGLRTCRNPDTFRLRLQGKASYSSQHHVGQL